VIGQHRLGHFAQDGQCHSRTVISKRIQERFHQFALIDAHQIAVLPLVKPNMNVREALERRTEPALRSPRAGSHSANSPHGTREKTDQAVGFTERVGLQDDGLGFVGWHQGIGALATAETICLGDFERTSASARVSAYETNFSITARHPAQLLNGLPAAAPLLELLAEVSRRS